MLQQPTRFLREIVPLITSLDSVGAGMLPIFSEAAAAALAESVKAHTFRDRTPTYGPRSVVQNFRVCEEEDVPQDSPIRRLALELEEKWNEALRLRCNLYDEPYLFATPLHFNDHLVLWYPQGDLGLGAHKDHSKYRNLIVSVTLCGRSVFNVHRGHDCPPYASFSVGPGDAVFMIAPGYRGKDIRPYHSVTHVTDERIALILKQKEICDVQRWYP
jgi:hypothetical protein